MQAQCKAWLFAFFDVSWVVRKGPQLEIPCSGKDAMEVRCGHGHTQACLGKTIHRRRGESQCQADRTHHGAGILPCVLALI